MKSRRDYDTYSLNSNRGGGSVAKLVPVVMRERSGGEQQAMKEVRAQVSIRTHTPHRQTKSSPRNKRAPRR
jgi:hypothetical protein